MLNFKYAMISHFKIQFGPRERPHPWLVSQTAAQEQYLTAFPRSSSSGARGESVPTARHPHPNGCPIDRDGYQYLRFSRTPITLSEFNRFASVSRLCQTPHRQSEEAIVRTEKVLSDRAMLKTGVYNAFGEVLDSRGNLIANVCSIDFDRNNIRGRFRNVVYMSKTEHVSANRFKLDGFWIYPDIQATIFDSAFSERSRQPSVLSKLLDWPFLSAQERIEFVSNELASSLRTGARQRDQALSESVRLIRVISQYAVKASAGAKHVGASSLSADLSTGIASNPIRRYVSDVSRERQAEYFAKIRSGIEAGDDACRALVRVKTHNIDFLEIIDAKISQPDFVFEVTYKGSDGRLLTTRERAFTARCLRNALEGNKDLSSISIQHESMFEGVYSSRWLVNGRKVEVSYG